MKNVLQPWALETGCIYTDAEALTMLVVQVEKYITRDADHISDASMQINASQHKNRRILSFPNGPGHPDESKTSVLFGSVGHRPMPPPLPSDI